MKNKFIFFSILTSFFFVSQGQISKKRSDSELKRIQSTVIEAQSIADQVILDDLIVDGSACIGFDCVNGESFGFDTIRLKENNLRIRGVDTSSTSSFPSRDWQITFNDSSNGGANKFSIDDIDGGRTPFTIEAGAPSHSLYVEDGGRLGLGTSNPVVEIHSTDGDTPALRLEQDGSSGFTPQTWDVAGNESGFFIRDATNGSKLPLRIRPNSPNNSMFITPTGVYVQNAILPGASAPSDIKFKENIISLSDATSVLQALLPKSFIYKNDLTDILSFPSGTQYGLIAQEIQKILPTVVHNKKLEDGESFLSVDYTALIPFLIQGFKEQQQIIDTQQEKIIQMEKEISNFASLDSRLSALENTHNKTNNAKR